MTLIDTLAPQPELFAAPVSASSRMAEFEQILLSNSGEDAFDCAIRLLSAKLADEINEEQGKVGAFSLEGSAEDVHARITKLYRDAIRRWPQLNGSDKELGIAPAHLVRTIRPLIGWRLRDSDLSWMDAVLERLVSRDSKGNLGQYFTPRDVIQLCVDVLNPSPADTVIDPACGSGGFLVEAAAYALKVHGKSPSCLGIDFGARALKVGALLSAAHPESHITVTNGNSLDGRGYKTEWPREWDAFASPDTGSKHEKSIGGHTAQTTLWGAWGRLSCSMLVTNPPFAGDIDDAELLSVYQSLKSPTLANKRRKAISREHLFLERAVHMLKAGGRMAIVVPQGLLSNPSAAYLREWLLDRCKILAVIGLHPHAFVPYTAVKTAVLFVEKYEASVPTDEPYKIFFAVSQSCGKDSSGRTSSRPSDYSELANQLGRYFAAQGLPWARPVPSGLELGQTTGEGMSWAAVDSDEVRQAGRLDAEFFEPSARAVLTHLTSRAGKALAEITDSRINRFKKNNYSQIAYLDISSVDARTGLPAPQTLTASEAPGRASFLVQSGDVLVSTVRPERNVVALVRDNCSVPQVASNGFCVLRGTEVTPEVLYAYCKTNAFKQALTRRATSSMYPTVSDRDVLETPFVEPSKQVQAKVTELVSSGLEMIENGYKKLDDAVALMNAALTNVSDSDG